VSYSSLEAMVGASLAPLFLGETSDVGEATIDGGTRGRRSPRWRRYGGLLDRMMSTSSPPWGIVFGDIHLLDGHLDGLVARRRSPRVSRVDTKMEWRVIYHLQRRVSAAWCSGARLYLVVSCAHS
jgi:hypothetical protein